MSVAVLDKNKKMEKVLKVCTFYVTHSNLLFYYRIVATYKHNKFMRMLQVVLRLYMKVCADDFIVG